MNKKILIGIVISVLLLGVIGLSYSFFSVSVTGEGRQNTVTAGTLELQYIDGNGVSLPRAYPGQSATKVISIKNTGTLETSYDLIYKDLINEIENDELVVSYTCTSYTGYVSSTNKGQVSGTCNGISNQVVPYAITVADVLLTEDIEISSGITHEYTFTFTFKEMNAAQNYNQGKHFSTKINITQPDVINVATYKLSGTLLDNNNDPITNATVEIHSKVKTGITDSKGYFEIEGVEVGDHEFKVKNSSGTYIIEDTIKVIEANESNVNGKEISIKEGEEGISLNIKTNNNGSLANLEVFNPNTLLNKILADNPVIKNDSTSLFANVADEASESGLFRTTDLTKTEDIDGDGVGEEVLYFRGVVENNYVIFAEYCWRIVRTNESGESIKLRYGGEPNGIECPQTGTKVNINNTNYSFSYSSQINNSKYVKWVHEDGMDSKAKTQVETWYTNEIETQGESITDLIIDEPYCNDTSVDSTIYYGARKRLYTYKSPQYKCPNASDKYTVDATKGNGKLSKPVALLTADEVAFAGGVSGMTNANSSYYLYTGGNYWTMSPFGWPGSNANEVYVASSGYLYYNSVGGSCYLLPSVSLSSEAMVADGGTGVYNNPYIIVAN